MPLREDGIMRKILSNRNIIITWTIAGVAILLICVFLCEYITQMILMWDKPNEYRDAVMIKLVQDLAQGDNPYRVSTLEESAPAVVVDSGFLNVLPAVGLVAVFHIPAAGALYLTNFFYLIGISVLIVLLTIQVFRESKSNRLVVATTAMLAIAVLLPFMNRSGYLVTRPDVLCVLLILIITYLLVKPTYRTADIILVSLCCAFIAYAKIHYAVVCISIVLYLALERRWRNLVWFIIAFFSSFLFLFVAIQILFPTYLSEWVYRILAMFLGVSNSDAWKGLFIKWLAIVYQLAIVFVVIGVSAILFVHRMRGNSDEKIPIGRYTKFVLFNAALNGLALMVVGKHAGAVLWYFYVMFVPMAVLLAIKGLQIAMDSNTNVWVIWGCLMLLQGMWRTYLVMDETKNVSERASQLEEAYAMIDTYQSDEMFLSPYLSGYSVTHGIYNYNYGDASFLVSDDFADSRWVTRLLGCILPYTKDIYHQHEAYWEVMLAKVENREYSLIALDDVDGFPTAIREELMEALEDNYREAASQQLKSSSTGVDVIYYIPNDRK